MEKRLRYSLIIISLFFGASANAQELVYEQDHGLSFTKGTINTDALVQIIQEKQEELNKFMLSNLMKKAVEDNENSRLDNFTTKYLIYETMNELTITADKSKFGKQTLELVKEAAIIFGISALVNEQFGDVKLASNITGEDDKLLETEFRDSIGFNQTLDMVLNACIENPKLSGYFPLYHKLANTDDPNRVWYENDSRYWAERDTLQAEYQAVLEVVNKVADITGGIGELRKNITNFPKGIFPSLERRAKAIMADPNGISEDSLVKFSDELMTVLNTVPQSLLNYTPVEFQEIVGKLNGFCADTKKIRENAALISGYIVKIKMYYDEFQSNDYLAVFKHLIEEVKDDVLPKTDEDFASQLSTLSNESGYRDLKANASFNTKGLDGNGLLTDLETIKNTFLAKSDYGSEFIEAVKRIEYDYANWKRIYQANGIDSSDLEGMMTFLSDNQIDKKKRDEIRDDLLAKFKLNTTIGRDQVYAVFQTQLGATAAANLIKAKGFGIYASVIATPILDSKFVDSLESKIIRLHNLAERSGIAQLTVNLVSRLEKTGSLKGFFFEKEQIDLTKDIMNYYIDYVSESGMFSVGPVFLKTVVDNISYQEADTLERRSASLSLNFESVLFTLNDKIVLPEWSYRTRHFQPFFQIGVNYANFVGANELNRADDGTTSRLQSMTYASEKMGIKYKWLNLAYTRSFSPGVVYKWNGSYYSWTSPPKMPFINEGYVDFHAGGLLYNAVNLNTEENFNFPFAGMGVGVKTFNGLSVSASYNFPFTNGLAEHGGWMDNGFVMLSFDVSIIEYIAAIRKK